MDQIMTHSAMGTMDDCKRRLLQTMMSQRVLSQEETLEIYQNCCEKYGVAIPDEAKEKLAHLNTLVTAINSNISGFGMEIKYGKDEFDGVICYGLVNTTESSVTLLASLYSENELEFFKKLLEMIVMSDHGTVGSIAAIAISDNLGKKMSKAAAEDLVDKLIQDKWICKTPNGKLYLSCRSHMELGQYIFTMFGEVAVRCNICKQLCLQGEKCGNCEAKLHAHCAQKIFSRPSADKVCPACHQSWTVDDEPQPSTSRASPTNMETTSSGRRKRKSAK